MNNLLEGVAGGSSGGGGGGYDWNDETNKSKVVFFCANGRHVFTSLSFFHLKSSQGFEYFEHNILGFSLYKPLKGCLGYKIALLSSPERRHSHLRRYP